jgi:hypothetical protein
MRATKAEWLEAIGCVDGMNSCLVDSALDNHYTSGIPSRGRFLDDTSVGESLFGAFAFSDTPEGHQFWGRVRRRIIGEQ